jgi:hypothetical protein
MRTFKGLTKFFIQANISAAEYWALMFVYLRTRDEEVPGLLTQYAKHFGFQKGSKWVILTIEQKQALVDKGYLTMDTTGAVALTEKFLNIHIDEYTAGQEFCGVYPPYAVIKGSNIPLKLGNRAEIRKLYWTAINASRKEHNEVLLDIDYGKDKGLLNMNLMNFTQSEGWHDLRTLRLADNQGSYGAGTGTDF